MKANELRHKNLVNYHGKAIEVFGVLGNVIYYNDGKCHDSNIGDYIAFEPIPLTPEWLERLGWIKHETFYSKPYGRNGVAIVKYEHAYKSFCYQLGTGHTKVLDHVHQLQNLHYAITGTELTLTGPKTTKQNG